MKFIENRYTWDLIVKELDDISSTQVKIDSNKEMIVRECKSLAEYSYENDIKLGKITDFKLSEMENEGKIFGSGIFLRIKKHYTILEKLEKKDYRRHIQILFNLTACIASNYYYKADEYTINKLLTFGAMLPDTPMIKEFDRHQIIRMVEASAFLRQYDIDINLKYGTFNCTSEMGKRIFDILNNKIYNIGGLFLLKKIYAEHLNQYIELFDHYYISRKNNQERNEPTNLLMNLALKNLRKHREVPNSQLKHTQIEEVFQIARSWLDVLDIEGSSDIEYAMINKKTFPIYFNNEIIFEKICIPNQYSKKFLFTIMKYLIKPWFRKADVTYSYDDYHRIMEYVINIENTCVYLDLQEMTKKTKVSKSKLKYILEDISIPINEVNINFNDLNGEINFQKRPLISFGNETYFYLDYHFTGIGFYLTACDMIKKNYSLLDRYQGYEVETMIRSEMTNKGYKFKYGKYIIDDNQFDCDMVMEKEKVFFFEMKKRDINRELDKIDDVAVLEQLSFGMIKAQKQCFVHEKNLNENGKLKLMHDDETFDYLYNKDEYPAYKISICLPEYSFLTSKVFCTNILETIVSSSFATTQKERQSKLNLINDLGKKILETAKQTSREKRIVIKDVVFYSVFCSAQQLLTALWCSNSQDEFLDIIQRWLYSINKLLNPYIAILEQIYHRDNPNDLKGAALDMLKKSDRKAIFVG